MFRLELTVEEVRALLLLASIGWDKYGDAFRTDEGIEEGVVNSVFAKLQAL